MKGLDTRLLIAHANSDLVALVALYTLAANRTTDTRAKRFYLTHAYVFALEIDHPDVPVLRDRL